MSDPQVPYGVETISFHVDEACSIPQTALEERLKQTLAIPNCIGVVNENDKMSSASMPSTNAAIEGASSPQSTQSLCLQLEEG